MLHFLDRMTLGSHRKVQPRSWIVFCSSPSDELTRRQRVQLGAADAVMATKLVELLSMTRHQLCDYFAEPYVNINARFITRPRCFDGFCSRHIMIGSSSGKGSLAPHGPARSRRTTSGNFCPSICCAGCIVARYGLGLDQTKPLTG